MATLHICITCRIRPQDQPADTLPLSVESGPVAVVPVDGQRLFDACVAATDQPFPLGIEPVRCLSACRRGCAVAFSGPERWSYVVGGLSPDRDVAMLLETARLYAAASDGVIPWRERPAHMRTNTIARLPPVPLPVPPSIPPTETP